VCITVQLKIILVINKRGSDNWLKDDKTVRQPSSTDSKLDWSLSNRWGKALRDLNPPTRSWLHHIERPWVPYAIHFRKWQSRRFSILTWLPWPTHIGIASRKWSKNFNLSHFSDIFSLICFLNITFTNLIWIQNQTLINFKRCKKPRHQINSLFQIFKWSKSKRSLKIILRSISSLKV
jgi:hypothetical protein